MSVHIPDGIYYIFLGDSQLCMDVFDASTADHGIIQVYPYKGVNRDAENQQWRVTNVYHDFYDDFYSIISVHSGLALDVPDALTTPTDIQQFEYQQHENQQWSFNFHEQPPPSSLGGPPVVAGGSYGSGSVVATAGLGTPPSGPPDMYSIYSRHSHLALSVPENNPAQWQTHMRISQQPPLTAPDAPTGRNSQNWLIVRFDRFGALTSVRPG